VASRAPFEIDIDHETPTAVDFLQLPVQSALQRWVDVGVQTAAQSDLADAFPRCRGSCLVYGVEFWWPEPVLHDFTADGNQDSVLREVARILKPRGRLAVVEFKDLDGPPGPPRHIRISPQQVEDALKPQGFVRQHLEDIGPYNYMVLFQAADVL